MSHDLGLLQPAEQNTFRTIDIDACNDDCQRYQGITNITTNSRQASQKTFGHFLVHDNQICDTRYSKSCGGISENNENVWNEPPKPYLRAIFDGSSKTIPDLKTNQKLNAWITNPPNCYCSYTYVDEKRLKKYIGKVDERGSYFRWSFRFTQAEITKIINQKCNTSFDTITSLKPLKRGVSGRITKLEISGKENEQFQNVQLNSEYEIRDALHPEFLYSSAFIIILDLDDNQIIKSMTLKGAGWGHGVGLCQIGALGMALSNKTSAEILSHYFPLTKIKKCMTDTISLHWIDWTIIVAYILFSLGVGIYFSKRAASSTEEYFLSGRSLPWWLVGTSMVATTFAADTPLAITEFVRGQGIWQNWFWWNLLMGALLSVFLFFKTLA